MSVKPLALRVSVRGDIIAGAARGRIAGIIKGKLIVNCCEIAGNCINTIIFNNHIIIGRLAGEIVPRYAFDPQRRAGDIDRAIDNDLVGISGTIHLDLEDGTGIEDIGTIDGLCADGIARRMNAAR